MLPLNVRIDTIYRPTLFALIQRRVNCRGCVNCNLLPARISSLSPAAADLKLYGCTGWSKKRKTPWGYEELLTDLQNVLIDTCSSQQ